MSWSPAKAKELARLERERMDAADAGEPFGDWETLNTLRADRTAADGVLSYDDQVAQFVAQADARQGIEQPGGGPVAAELNALWATLTPAQKSQFALAQVTADNPQYTTPDRGLFDSDEEYSQARAEARQAAGAAPLAAFAASLDVPQRKAYDALNAAALAATDADARRSWRREGIPFLLAVIGGVALAGGFSAAPAAEAGASGTASLAGGAAGDTLATDAAVQEITVAGVPAGSTFVGPGGFSTMTAAERAAAALVPIGGAAGGAATALANPFATASAAELAAAGSAPAAAAAGLSIPAQVAIGAGLSLATGAAVQHLLPSPQPAPEFSGNDAGGDAVADAPAPAGAGGGTGPAAPQSSGPSPTDIETARRQAIIANSNRKGRAASILTGGQGAAAPALLRRPELVAAEAPPAHRALLGYRRPNPARSQILGA